MVKLYIENQFIELDNEVQFAITKTFEDITNPTSIINDWSKTVSIPFTDNNNEVFGHIYNPDRLTLYTSDESLTTGLYFDPLKKLDFRLEWDSMLLMQGYAKMTSVTKSNGKGRYNVTLNGELGKVFQEMKKITFDETAYTGEDKDKYWIDGSIYVKENLNKELIKTCFETEPVSLELYNKNHYKYKVTDIIGFTANNSKIPDFFKYDSCEYESYKSKQFATILDEKEWTSSTGEVFKEFLLQTGVEPSTIVENGLLPRQVGEFRSYLQLPFIYFNKLFQIFTKKVEDLTDYKCTLDGDWFNGGNPYWNNLVYMLAPFYDEGSESEEVYSNFVNDDILTNAFGVYDYGDAKILANSRNNWELVDGSNILNSSKQMFINHGSEYEFEVNLNNMQIATLNGGYVKCKINPKQTFFLDLVFKPNDSTGIQETIPLFAIMDDSANFSYDGYETIKIGDLTDNYTQNDKNYFSSTFNLAKVVRTHKFIKNTENGYFNVWISVRHLPVNQSYTMYRFERENEYGTISTSNQETLIKLNTNENTNILNLKYKVKNIQSSYTFNLNTLWNKKYNLFSEILKYCKMYKILIKIDDSNKTINFVQFNKYFQNFTIEDWSNKLDLSKDYIIKPITFENKYVLFNYDDFDSDLYKEYKELFGFGYGEYKLTTEYNFNSEEKKLFEGIKPSIIYTPNILSWQTLDDCKIEYYVPYEKYIYNSDAEGKNTDVFGSMFFYNGLQNFDAELGDVYISDDTEFQKVVSEFMYITFSSSDKVKVSKFPNLDIVGKNNLSTFGTPLLNYTLDSTSYDNKTNLFTNFWQKYLDERYNTNNKIVTCYLDITPIDYYNFDFNKFIKIDNQLYFVNKIYDYDITSNSTTKVDLITVQDLNGYTTNNFVYPYFIMYWTNKQPYDHEFDYVYLDDYETETTIYLTSTSDVSWYISNIEEGSGDNITVNGEKTSGVINKGEYSPITIGCKKGTNRVEITFIDKFEQSYTVSVVTELTVEPLKIQKSDNSIVSDWETLTLAGQETQSLTVYVTSDTDVEVSIHNHSGSLADVQINGADAIEVYHGYDTVTLEAGTKVPLTISTVWGGDDFNLEMYLQNGLDDRVFYVDCVW